MSNHSGSDRYNGRRGGTSGRSQWRHLNMQPTTPEKRRRQDASQGRRHFQQEEDFNENHRRKRPDRAGKTTGDDAERRGSGDLRTRILRQRGQRNHSNNTTESRVARTSESYDPESDDKTRVEMVKNELKRFTTKVDRWEKEEKTKPRQESNTVETDKKNGEEEESKFEFDLSVLVRRQKQIDYGKRTDGYKRYRQTVPRAERLKEHPRTPNKFMKNSRRKWDFRIRLWRRLLHCWDDPTKDDATAEQDALDLTANERLSESGSYEGEMNSWALMSSQLEDEDGVSCGEEDGDEGGDDMEKLEMEAESFIPLELP